MACIVISLVLLAAAFPLHALAAGKGLSIELIHRDSPRSPFYDPSSTTFDHATAAAKRSIARARHLGASLAPTAGTIRSKLTPADAEYSMEFQLGTPPTTVVAIADTGSDLMWTNCKPCDRCFPQIPPLFDPATSSTYKTVPCDTDPCNDLPNKSCGQGSSCAYHFQYADQSNVDGTLSFETATFISSTGANAFVTSLVFGCNSQSSGSTFGNKVSGLVGLGPGPLSLVSQISLGFQKKFSFCMVSRRSSSSSKISFGDDAIVPGANAVTTPLTIARGAFYTLNLEEISVGGTSVDVTRVPPVESGTGNVAIDSGTTLTILDGSVVDDVVKAVQVQVTVPSVPDPSGVGFPACYDMGASGSLAQFPDVTFKFTGAAVVLDPLNWLIMVNSNTVCLAMSVRAADSGIPQLFGNIAQQNIKVGYDLVGNVLSFEPADCTSV